MISFIEAYNNFSTDLLLLTGLQSIEAAAVLLWNISPPCQGIHRTSNSSPLESDAGQHCRAAYTGRQCDPRWWHESWLSRYTLHTTYPPSDTLTLFCLTLSSKHLQLVHKVQRHQFQPTSAPHCLPTHSLYSWHPFRPPFPWISILGGKMVCLFLAGPELWDSLPLSTLSISESTLTTHLSTIAFLSPLYSITIYYCNFLL